MMEGGNVHLGAVDLVRGLLKACFLVKRLSFGFQESIQSYTNMFTVKSVFMSHVIFHVTSPSSLRAFNLQRAFQS